MKENLVTTFGNEASWSKENGCHLKIQFTFNQNLSFKFEQNNVQHHFDNRCLTQTCSTYCILCCKKIVLQNKERNVKGKMLSFFFCIYLHK